MVDNRLTVCQRIDRRLESGVSLVAGIHMIADGDGESLELSGAQGFHNFFRIRQPWLTRPALSTNNWVLAIRLSDCSSVCST